MAIDDAVWGPLADRYRGDRPRRMLALDGGGIRGVLTLAILQEIERQVGVRLCDYFDYIAGTSTGAIIAAALARGKTVDEVLTFYRSAGPAMFERTRFLERLNSLYRNGALERQLKEVFGEHTDLRPEHLRTLLLVVTRNVTTDSPWPISSNPDARYNAPRPDCNLRIPLWQIVRASTAAPIFFPPEVIELGSQSFVFVDGGMTPYNNPSFLLYRFATEPAYRLGWARGERRLLLVSVGTGNAATLGATADSPGHNILATGLAIPTALMYAASIDQDTNCRTVGRCTFGAMLDREQLDLVPREGTDTGSLAERLARRPVPLATDLGRAFLYVRYNVDLSAAGLQALGFDDADPDAVQKLDNATPANIAALLAIGGAASRQVDVRHFGPFAPAAAGA